MIRRFFNWVRNLFPHKGAVTINELPPIGPVCIPEHCPTVDHDFPSVTMGTISAQLGETPMIHGAFDDLNKILASPIFKQKVLSAEFTETNGMTNSQIYDLLVKHSGTAVDLTMFNGTWIQNHSYGTVGYEDVRYPNVCFANRYFVYAKETLGSLLLHELMHILGFHHYGVKSTSVSYVMNGIYTECAQELHLAAA